MSINMLWIFALAIGAIGVLISAAGGVYFWLARRNKQTSRR